MTAPDALAKLRQPFADHQIGLLPKQVKKDDPDKGRCGGKYSADGKQCGGWHARSVHLDYVGHAALTDRLLDADLHWTWEPVAFGADGLPVIDKAGGLWIRLTVGGVTRLGYGDSQGKTGPNAVKEAIGDALRNAAMRFGAALDLWHKGDLHAAEVDRGVLGGTDASSQAPATPQGASENPAWAAEDYLAALRGTEAEAQVVGIKRDAGLAGLLDSMVTVPRGDGAEQIALGRAIELRLDWVKARNARPRDEG